MPPFMVRNVSFLWGLVAALLISCSPAPTDPDLVPRSALLGDPSRVQLRLSPDGQTMSFLAPEGGVLNLWVAPRGAFDEARPITQDRMRGIHAHFWNANSDLILFKKEPPSGGGTHIYSVDPSTGTVKDLTPGEDTNARLVAWSWEYPDEILVALNTRNPTWHDLYRLNVRTGDKTLIETNNRFTEYIADQSLTPRYALGIDVEGTRVFKKTGDTWEIERAIAPADALTFKLAQFEASGRYLYFVDSSGRNTTALHRLDTETGLTDLLGASSVADVEKLITHPKSGIVQAFAVEYDRKRWEAVDPAIETHLNNVVEFAVGPFQLVNRTPDDKTWVIYIDKLTEPGAYYFYDTDTQSFEFQFSIVPELEGTELVASAPQVITARDGFELVSYLTLPEGTDEDGDGRPDVPLPLVLTVHSGPWHRDSFGFNEWHQWLANRGYAVLSVNFRGSTGFGKAFLNAGNGEWGAKMQDDLLDAVDWAISAGIADEDRIAIFGGSYGGYAALSGLAFTPDRFACAVSISGPANLITHIESVPAYWESMRTLMRARVGDPTTREGQALLEARSPLFKADEIVKPLLIAHGGKDVSVKRSEIEEIVASLTERGVPVVYLLYPDESHGIKTPANAIAFYAAAEAFLGECLGGKVQSFGNDLDTAKLELHGSTDYVPELKSAWRRR